MIPRKLTKNASHNKISEPKKEEDKLKVVHGYMALR
jgi:hypothetical protein